VYASIFLIYHHFFQQVSPREAPANRKKCYLAGSKLPYRFTKQTNAALIIFTNLRMLSNHQLNVPPSYTNKRQTFPECKSPNIFLTYIYNGHNNPSFSMTANQTALSPKSTFYEFSHFQSCFWTKVNHQLHKINHSTCPQW